MKITLKRILVICGLFAVLFIVARVTGIYQSYRIEFDGMEPSIKAGSVVIFVKKKPSKGKVVAFNRQTPPILGIQPESYIEISRVVGMEFDTIRLIDFRLFVNGEEISEYPLQYLYKVPIEAMPVVSALLPGSTVSRHQDYAAMKIPDEAFERDLSGYDFEKIHPGIDHVMQFYNALNVNWDWGNYGPFVVPEDHCFVLSDYRNSAYDSRSYGPIPLSKIKGVRTKNIDWMLKAAQAE